jgi:hypothetical protein
MYDTVAQYGQVLSGDVDDWHPPIMVRLWQLLLPLGRGTGSMFILQVGLYAFGFALIADALARCGRWRAAVATGVLALSPLLLGWQMIVLKDAQMLGALIAACGIIAHYRIRQRRISTVVAAFVALLIGYATLVRANALFATVPLTVLIVSRPASLFARCAIGVCAIVLLIAVEPFINDQLLGAAPSGVAKSQALFDLAAVDVGSDEGVVPFTSAERAQLIHKHCVKSFFWDAIRDPSACGPDTERVNALSERQLYFDLAQAATRHPLLYAEHRLRHWNSTERWLVPPGRIGAAPPDDAEPNDIGLAAPSSPLMPLWQRLAGWEARTPLGWPIVWTVLALVLLPSSCRRRREPAGSLAFALVVSCLVLEASFLVISIASDLRYHLWSMAAVPLAFILLGGGMHLPRAKWASAAVLLALVCAGGVIARSTFQQGPTSYQGMVHAPSG